MNRQDSHGLFLVLLTRVKKRSWRGPNEMKEVFTSLASHHLSVGDVVWMLSDPDRMVRHYATELVVGRTLEGASAAVLKEALDATGNVRAHFVATLPKLADDSAFPRLDKMLTGRDDAARDLALDVVLSFPTDRVE